MPIEGRNTAHVFAFLNKLSDAFNGKVAHGTSTAFRTLLTDSSFHMAFFDEAKAKLARMRYVERGTHVPISRQPPSLQNLKKTIDGTQLLWKKLQNLGFKQLKTKHVNQDPLENFFGLIRDHGAQNTKPTCYQFIGHFKALVVNNLTHYHVLDANCGDDEGSLLLSWQNYLSFADEASLEDFPEELPRPKKVYKRNRKNPQLKRPKIVSCASPIPEKGNISNEIAVIMKKFKQKVPSLNSCPDCMALVQVVEGSCVRKVDTIRKSALEYIHAEVTSLLRRIMVSIYHEIGILQTAVAFMLRETRTEVITCQIHKESLLHNFLCISVEQYIRATAAYLNRILKGNLQFSTEAAEEKGASKNRFVARAIIKRKASLHKKETYSTLSKKKSQTFM